MKSKLKITALCVLTVFTIMYAVIAFITLEWSPLVWEPSQRFGYVMFSAAATVMSLVFIEA